MKTLVNLCVLCALGGWILPASAPTAPAKGRPAAAVAPSAEPKPVTPGKKAEKRVLIVTGVDIGSHRWQQTAPALGAIIDADPRLAVDIVETPQFVGSPKLADYDAIVLHFYNPKRDQ